MAPPVCVAGFQLCLEYLLSDDGEYSEKDDR